MNVLKHLAVAGRAAAALIVTGLAGCAATIDQGGLEQTTSASIGRQVGDFTITEKTEGTGGRIDYKVRTKDGVNYSCLMYSATGFQKAMSFGQTPNSSAICTQMVKGSTPAAAAPAASCNVLLKAAGKC